MKDKLRLAILASGRGSNMLALIEACERGEIDAEVVLVLSDKPDARALVTASEHSIPTRVIERRAYGSREEFDAALAGAVAESGAELVCLAGFMRILSGAFLDRCGGAVVNVHPALLPSFPGLDAQKQALEHGVKIAGCTVHFVDGGVDTGRIILQSAVPVEPDDTVESLSARILEQEHRIYPRAVQLFAEGAVRPPKAVENAGSR